MNIIIGKRGSGKTTEMIKRSAEEGIYILVATKCRRNHVLDMAQKMGCAIPYPVTIDECFHSNKFAGSSIRLDGILIDDADDVLKWIFQGIPIKGITITDNGSMKYKEDY